jgi:hypothetical protein
MSDLNNILPFKRPSSSPKKEKTTSSPLPTIDTERGLPQGTYHVPYPIFWDGEEDYQYNDYFEKKRYQIWELYEKGILMKDGANDGVNEECHWRPFTHLCEIQVSHRFPFPPYNENILESFMMWAYVFLNPQLSLEEAIKDPDDIHPLCFSIPFSLLHRSESQNLIFNLAACIASLAKTCKP